jgi:hypothetical protein
MHPTGVPPAAATSRGLAYSTLPFEYSDVPERREPTKHLIVDKPPPTKALVDDDLRGATLQSPSIESRQAAASSQTELLVPPARLEEAAQPAWE